MENERKILVAIDESKESMHALSWCITNFMHKDSDVENRLVLLYVKSPPPAYFAFDPTGYVLYGDVVETPASYCKDLANFVMGRAEAILRGINPSNIKIERMVRRGDAKDEICRVVEKIKPDTLVMGSHGYGFFKRNLLGSVSDHCAKRAKCPVIIVKHP